MAFSAEALRKQLGKVREGARGAGRASSRRGWWRCAARPSSAGKSERGGRGRRDGTLQSGFLSPAPSTSSET